MTYILKKINVPFFNTLVLCAVQQSLLKNCAEAFLYKSLIIN
jgi:hypothetical protein